MYNKVKLLACLAGIVAPCLVMTAGPTAADETFAVTGTIDVGTITSFDISFVDANIHTLVQSHRDTPNCGADPHTDGGVDVINTNSNMRTTTLCGFHGTAHEHGPNGVVIVDQKEVWAGDGLIAPETSTLKAVDIATGTTVVMNTGGAGRTDELCEAVGHEIIMAANDRAADLFMTFWSTESHSLLGKISFKGAPADPNAAGIVAAGGIEQCKFDPRTNRFLIAIPQPSSPAGVTGVVAVVTAEAPFKVVDVFKILPSSQCDQGPHGLALGPKHQVLLGCGSPSAASLIIDDRNGNTIFGLPGVSSDEVWYNPGDNHYFLVPTNAAGTAGTLAPVDAETGAEDAQATAGSSSRVVAADMLKNQVYVVLPGPDDVKSGGSGLCSNSANGCIGVYTAKNDDACLAKGMPVLDHDDGDDPVFMRVRCSDDRDSDNHDHDR
jgi:hypothetical protein